MCWRPFLILLLITVDVKSEEKSTEENETGGEFLRNMIQQIRNEQGNLNSQNSYPISRIEEDTKELQYSKPKLKETGLKIMGPTPLPDTDNTDGLAYGLHSNTNNQHGIFSSVGIPAPPLSKEELSALYQAAIKKGATLDLSGLTDIVAKNPQVSSGLQDLSKLLQNYGPASTSGVIPGYYYYFYPIKGLVKQEESNKQNEASGMKNDMSTSQSMTDMVHMDASEMSDSQKNVEPLFMAIAGFIGMAVMYIVSVLFLPKFGSLRSREIVALKSAPDDLSGLTKVVFEALDGKDCSERIICEIGQTIRRMQLDRKSIRVMELLLPPGPAKQLQKIRQAASKREKCAFVQCRLKASKKTR
ncbi:uncharacterized protein LOC126248332 [Schistocerca nitens]|uniref:uncharacterized protein LOC126248332 n=1 Tax=Schistocerca nitens TaxID=7011 RepID=UPI00211824EB|nr:uncharacterized protein LOC126248332 [Schistocerca nitens]